MRLSLDEHRIEAREAQGAGGATHDEVRQREYQRRARLRVQLPRLPRRRESQSRIEAAAPRHDIEVGHGSAAGLGKHRGFPWKRERRGLGSRNHPGTLSDRERQAAFEHRHAPIDSRKTREGDRKSTRLNSSHITISYAVFCLKKKKKKKQETT